MAHLRNLLIHKGHRQFQEGAVLRMILDLVFFGVGTVGGSWLITRMMFHQSEPGRKKRQAEMERSK